MIVELGHRHLGHQARSSQPLVDHLRGHRCGLDRLAARAGVLAADVAQHEELGRHAVELLADLFADALEGLTAGAVRLLDLVVTLDARQVRGQCLAHRLTLDARGGRRRLDLVQGGEVFEQRVGQEGVEQHRLGRGIQALAGRAEAPALEARDLKVQRLDPGLAELELGLQALDPISQHLHRIVFRRGVECLGG